LEAKGGYLRDRGEMDLKLTEIDRECQVEFGGGSQIDWRTVRSSI
jgi:hypothetical protein